MAEIRTPFISQSISINRCDGFPEQTQNFFIQEKLSHHDAKVSHHFTFIVFRCCRKCKKQIAFRCSSHDGVNLHFYSLLQKKITPARKVLIEIKQPILSFHEEKNYRFLFEQKVFHKKTVCLRFFRSSFFSH